MARRIVLIVVVFLLIAPALHARGMNTILNLMNRSIRSGMMDTDVLRVFKQFDFLSKVEKMEDDLISITGWVGDTQAKAVIKGSRLAFVAVECSGARFKELFNVLVKELKCEKKQTEAGTMYSSYRQRFILRKRGPNKWLVCLL